MAKAIYHLHRLPKQLLRYKPVSSNPSLNPSPNPNPNSKSNFSSNSNFTVFSLALEFALSACVNAVKCFKCRVQIRAGNVLVAHVESENWAAELAKVVSLHYQALQGELFSWRSDGQPDFVEEKHFALSVEKRLLYGLISDQSGWHGPLDKKKEKAPLYTAAVRSMLEIWIQQGKLNDITQLPNIEKAASKLAQRSKDKDHERIEFDDRKLQSLSADEICDLMLYSKLGIPDMDFGGKDGMLKLQVCISVYVCAFMRM